MTDRIVMPPERIQAALTEAERRMWEHALALDQARAAGVVPTHRSPRRVDLPWKGCSTCRRPMMERKRKGLHDGWHHDLDRTKGHFRPHGPYEGAYGDGRRWAYQCYRCNQDQKDQPLTGWLTWLRRYRDSRTQHVAALIDHLRSVGVTDL